MWAQTAETDSAEVLPDGCMDLIWTGAEILVAGPDTVVHPVPGPAGKPYVGLRLAPGTMPAVLGIPAHALRDRRVPLADLLTGDVAARLTEVATTAGAPGAVLEAFAAGCLREHPRPRWTAAVSRMLATGVGVRSAAERIGLGERTLHRSSLHAFGYGPKRLARILRMTRALDLVRAGVPLAAVAALCGYADQPHLSREVRELAGRSPGEFA